uniref:Inositol polyphosphate-4-phosphatase type II B n=1 Tax=Lates calcarifer TaxID=8187 RepID=A0A4W6EWU1_LATCA
VQCFEKLYHRTTHLSLAQGCTQHTLKGSGKSQSVLLDRKPNALVQVAVIDPHKQHLVTHACTEIVEANKDPLFLTGVTFPSEYPASPETLVKLTVYDAKDKSQESILCFTFLKVKKLENMMLFLLRQIVHNTFLPSLCLSPSVFKNPICKVYRFQTMDSKWMLVREQMEECTLSFSIPKQLLSLYIQEDMSRVQDLRDLGELSPHWDNLRKEVMTRYGGIISSYQETLAELDKITGRSFKPSCCKAQKSLEFIPINLHTQRMRVTCPRKTDAFYDIVTVGAPAAHFQGFKCGGLQRLLSRYEAEKKSFSTAYQCIYYSPEHTAKAQEVLSTVSLLQPLITSLADQLLQAAQEHSSTGLKDALKNLSDKVRKPPPNPPFHLNSPFVPLCCNTQSDWREQLCPLVTRLKECVMEVVEKAKKAMTFVLLQEAACSIPQGFLLQQRRDVVFSQALAALACGFVMRLYAGMQDKGFLRQLHLVGLIAQFESLLSTYSEEIGMLEDMEVGISDLQRVAFKITEAKTDDLSDLQPLVCGRRDHFTVEVPLPRPVFQTLPEEIKEGKPLRVFPVLFNVGINEQQTIAERFGDISLQERINQKNFEMLEAYYKSLSEKVPLECLPCFQTQTDIKELLETLGQNVVTKKRKNVEILWIAGTICRRLNGIRFTSCKSAKDRTSMSVTLEQCAILRDEHQLSKDFFIRALDCMRREGCRIENVQKNIRCRKYAFNMLQLMAFPKCYRPPEGTYGKVDS